MNWNDLVKRIPHRVRIKGRTYYEVVWVDSFSDNALGETRFDRKQIALKIGQTPKQATLTYLHEVLHATSYLYDINLTETQVIALESSLPVLMANGNIFAPKSRKKT